MKKPFAILFALLMLLNVCACGEKSPEASAGNTPAPTAAPTEPAPSVPADTPVPTEEPEFITMRLDALEYGRDYSSLYEVFGAEISIADVYDGGDGTAYIERDGRSYELGLDFLSNAMIYNCEPAGEFDTPEKVSAEWWRYFMIRWNRLLPSIPFYSNEYCTIFNTEIKGVKENPVNPYFDPERAVLYWTSEKEDGSIIMGSFDDPDGRFRFVNEQESRRRSNYGDDRIDALVNGAELVALTKDGGVCWNDTVVKEHEEERTEAGLKVTITLWDDLYFSDGSPITAKDYIAKPMVCMTSVFREAFPEQITGYDYIAGSDDPFCVYPENGGEADRTLTAIRLIDDRRFSITVKPELSYGLYAFAQLGLRAQSAKLWLCGADIIDDGRGCLITDPFYRKDDGIPQKYTYAASEELQKLAYDMSAENEDDAPWSGPYRIKYAGPAPETQDTYIASLVILERNEYYKGNYEGVKPSIGTVYYRNTRSALVMTEIAEGKLDIYSGISGAAATEEALRIAAGSEGRLDILRFTHAGYGAVMFRADLGPVQFASVRRALAYCMDRERFSDEWVGEEHVILNAPIHRDLWRYQLAVKRGLELNEYEFSVDKAIEELTAGGWIYNEKGEPYDGGIRYKRIPADAIDEKDKQYKGIEDGPGVVKAGDDYYMPLVLNMFMTPDSGGIAVLYTLLTESVMERIGAECEVMEGDMGWMINELNQAPIYGYGIDVIEPRFDVFLYAASFKSHTKDYCGAFSIDPAKRVTDPFLRDAADVFMLP